MTAKIDKSLFILQGVFDKYMNIKMDGRANQKKLVDAFRTFFEKTISPYVSNNESIMNEWKYLSRLISSQPIDYNQIQFYLLLANKSPHPQTPSAPQSELRNTSYGSNLKYGTTQLHAPNQKLMTDSDKKSSNSKTMTVSSPKKKNLVACLQMFQNMLIKNQQKLESYGNGNTIGGRRQTTNAPMQANVSKRYYE